MFQKKLKISNKIIIQIVNKSISISLNEKTVNQKIPDSLKLTFDSGYLILESANKALIGLYYSILKKKIQGLIQNFKKILILSGLGFKIFKEKNQLILKLGYSHDILIDIPKNITVELLKSNQFILYSFDWGELTQFCANLKKLRKINPYKGKGLLFKNENIKLKEGKKK